MNYFTVPIAFFFPLIKYIPGFETEVHLCPYIS